MSIEQYLIVPISPIISDEHASKTLARHYSVHIMHLPCVAAVAPSRVIVISSIIENPRFFTDILQ